MLKSLNCYVKRKLASVVEKKTSHKRRRSTKLLDIGASRESQHCAAFQNLQKCMIRHHTRDYHKFKSLGFYGKLLGIVKALYDNPGIKIRTGKDISDSVPIYADLDRVSQVKLCLICISTIYWSQGVCARTRCMH